MEFVLPDRRVRPRARRLVAEPEVFSGSSRNAVHGHRLRGLHADRSRARPDLSDAGYLRYELTAIAYQLSKPSGIHGAGHRARGGRDLLSALVFGATRRWRRDQSDHRSRRHAGTLPRFLGRHLRSSARDDPVDDGRSFVRRVADKYDVIQASLVDTWAATGRWGLHADRELALHGRSVRRVPRSPERQRYADDHPMGLRRPSAGLAGAGRLCAAGLGSRAAYRHRCGTIGWPRFCSRNRPLRPSRGRARRTPTAMEFRMLYAPGSDASPIAPAAGEMVRSGREPPTTPTSSSRPIASVHRRNYQLDIRPTTDDRPFFFHTTRLADQFDVAFGRSMLFGNGLSALLTLLGISAALVAAVRRSDPHRRRSRRVGLARWLAYFGALGAGFMLIEVALLQRFVLLLGHPVYSLTVTLFSLLLGTGLGSVLSRGFTTDRGPATRPRAGRDRRRLARCSPVVVPLVDGRFRGHSAPNRPRRRAPRPLGIVLGMALPAACACSAARAPGHHPWAWGMNGAFSVVGATLAVFIAMNWAGQRLDAVAGVEARRVDVVPDTRGGAAGPRRASARSMPIGGSRRRPAVARSCSARPKPVAARAS